MQTGEYRTIATIWGGVEKGGMIDKPSINGAVR